MAVPSGMRAPVRTPALTRQSSLTPRELLKPAPTPTLTENTAVMPGVSGSMVGLDKDEDFVALPVGQKTATPVVLAPVAPPAPVSAP
jgi:hypothetical protein